MNRVKTVTHLLFPILVGLVIGGAIRRNPIMLAFGILLLTADVVIGVALQYTLENGKGGGGEGGLPPEVQKEVLRLLLEEAAETAEEQKSGTESEAEPTLAERFDEIYIRLKAGGGARLTEIIYEDEAGRFLIDFCSQLAHAPLPRTILRLCTVAAEEVDGMPAIIYAFRYWPGSICQNVYMFLVRTERDKMRLFAVETDYAKFVLCEYIGNGHRNYGPVKLENIPCRIAEVLRAEGAGAPQAGGR